MSNKGWSMRNIRELFVLARCFGRYLSGSDYFRQPQNLGAYFTDARCYYNDMRHKGRWDGPYVAGVPAYRLASTGQDIVLPVMVLQYGLGSFDLFFLENDSTHLDGARRVAEWMIRAILPEGYYDAGSDFIDPNFEYYSNNSAMSQGLALSFAVRAIQCELIDEPLRSRLRDVVDRVVANMLLPVQQQGAALYEGDDLFLLEYCRKDHNVVLNGWVFAVFGLIDYLRLATNTSVEGSLRTTLGTMKRMLPKYCLHNGWSYYDNMERISSPFYHDLHISLLDAMYRLTGAAEFEECKNRFLRANGGLNRAWYTLHKIKDKLLDKDVV
jgi:heparosan-N-sulfate-glucuronate 5-epimerase